VSPVGLPDSAPAFKPRKGILVTGHTAVSRNSPLLGHGGGPGALVACFTPRYPDKLGQS
jgi:hypothetical protein